ncbi:uncharacterized protein ACRADG_009006 [Cochliomyia hominivorax]
MNKLLKIVYFIVATVRIITAPNDYCDKTLCYLGKHVACSDGKFSPNCPPDAILVDINEVLQKVIIDGHNEKRNLVAGGKAENHKPACRMATMQWDPELAYFASFNVKQCNIDHDECRNTRQFHYTGQNLAVMPYMEPLDVEARLQQSIQMWYDEVSYSKQEYIDSMPENRDIIMDIGHFTALVTDRNIRVGCAASIYSIEVPFGIPSHKSFLTACNYAAANLPNVPIYIACDKPATNCLTGTNTDFPYLCSIQEEFDFNYVIVGFTSLIVAITAEVDYCNFPYCYDLEHIACENDGNFHSDCPSDADLVDINESIQQLLVNKHNKKRNFVAGGGVEHLKPACRMATMEWDEQLAQYASFNVKQCEIEYDVCHNTEQFHYSGQNILFWHYTGELNVVARFNASIEIWYKEVSRTKQEHIDLFPEDSDTFRNIGHFTAIVSDRNIRLGCAASTYSIKGPKRYRNYKGFSLACNYAAANLPDFPIYSKCDEPAKDCLTGTNPIYPNLCSVEEEFDYNYGFV